MSPLLIFLGKSGSIPYIAYFAISFGSFVLLLNLNGIIISVLMSSPNTHALPCNTASVAKGEIVDFGGDGIRGDDGGGGEDDSGWEDDDVELCVVVLSSAAKLQIPLWTCNFAFYCRGSR